MSDEPTGADPWQALTGLSDRLKRLEGQRGEPAEPAEQAIAERAYLLGALFQIAGAALIRARDFPATMTAVTTAVATIVADVIDAAHEDRDPGDDETEGEECEE